jgi:tether containing UBX domain for GLUT4
MRELDDLKRKKVFQTAVIRVQFPDKGVCQAGIGCHLAIARANYDVHVLDEVVLQATFHPNERVQDVIDHVKESLASVHANLDFYLYVSPPFQKLPAAKTLTDSTLVPAALVYLSWQTAPEGGMEPGFYLRQELVGDRAPLWWKLG